MWLKGVFRVRSETKHKNKEPSHKVISKKKLVEVTQTPGEKSIEAPGKKIIEVTPLSKEKLLDSLEKEAHAKIVQEQPRGEKPRVEPSKKSKVSLTTKETETEIKRPAEEHKIKGENGQEGKDTRKSRKPYKKKAPTEERKKERGRPSVDQNRQPDIKRRKEIDLGATQRKKSKSAGSLQQFPLDKETKKMPEKEEVTTRVESPFVEINLDEAKVFLIIPEQQFKSEDTATSMLRQLDYKLELNGKIQTIPVKVVIKDNQSSARVEEKRIELEKPLKTFQVVFPDELQGRIYNYKHSNRNLYAFTAIGNNRGRMHYLYDKEGNINPIPKRVVWILLEEDFELGTEPKMTDERWVWGTYQPLYVNLKKTNELAIKNRETGKEEKIPCETTFSIEGEQSVDDDFKEQTPLFIGKSVKIKAPKENPSGWMVWIQNKQAGYRIIDDSWTGIEALQLKLLHDLPCECGEFQVDICNQDERVPVETLFFRYIPFLQIEYQNELIVPDPYHGHKPEIIKVVLKSNFQDWELKTPKKIELKENGYQIELPPEEDILHFSITKRGKPETEVRLRITAPRLKWRTSKQETWNDKSLQIKRDELVTGTHLYLCVCTNDFDSQYDLLAILEANNQKLQEAKFIRKGITYNLLLDQFDDTIKKDKNKMTVRIEVRKAKSEQLLDQVDILYFPELLKEKPKDKLRKPLEGSFKPVKKRPYLKLLKERDIKNIRPIVKGGRGMRKGKGLSRQEIVKSGIDVNDIRRLHIPFDSRRKSAHPQNVETLESLIGSE